MYIIVGLGNPEKKYINTRHNIGFDVINAIAEKNDIAIGEKKHKAVIGKGIVAGQKAVLVKPLDMGQIRIRKRGSDGGHNGLKNIIMHLGHDEFIRVRMGVGEKPPRMDLADYVLSHFSTEEREVMNESARTAALAIETVVAEGPDAAMNKYNRKRLP